jgi:hypothetical protein
METIHDTRYEKLVAELRAIRKEAQLSQEGLATKLNEPQSFVAKIETLERRLDVIELLDYLKALHTTWGGFFARLGWLDSGEGIAVPIRGEASESAGGVVVPMLCQKQRYNVTLQNIKLSAYIDVEKKVESLFRNLNRPGSNVKNRDAIAQAFAYAMRNLPKANPSDVYQHIIYRLYIREYTMSDPKQSWVRAGGEGVELFIERHYKDELAKADIIIEALIGKDSKRHVLKEMKLEGTVGSSKLDMALFDNTNGIKKVIGGIHSKASLAERVSDDETCSRAMMAKGFLSYLYTFDSKSFPPPHGDLINYGELGSERFPSDKRKYVTEHGSFNACFCYNTRIEPSPVKTKSGKRIYVSSLDPLKDPFVKIILADRDRLISSRDFGGSRRLRT